MKYHAEIGLIGAGNLGEALVSGLLQCKTFHPRQIQVATLSTKRSAFLAKKYKVVAAKNNVALLKNCKVVILATKPQTFLDLATELRGHFTPQHLVISVAAGITLARLHKLFCNQRNDTPRFIRAMPNTPCLIGQGVSCFFVEKEGSPQQRKRDTRTVKKVLSSCGRVFQVNAESQMDAVTGLSGSGPAYFFYILEALIAAGEKAGLPRALAFELALETAIGSFALVKKSGEDPAALRKKVTSPRGTTLEGIKALEEGFLGQTLERAVLAATGRAKDLGNDF